LYGVQFDLHVRYPKHSHNDIEAALWAWVNFGGIGARTRRGCGALFCPDFAPPGPQSEQIKAWLKEWWGKLELHEPRMSRDWPVLDGRCWIGPPGQDPLETWSRGIELLRRFRQGVGIGRNPGDQPNRPGRSRWPEPETIRRATRRRHNRHARLDAVPDKGYPRAEFGLPIVFHFKDKGDPPDTLLLPENGSSRLASPLILKPLALGSGRFVPIVLKLLGPHPTQAVLAELKTAKEIHRGPVRDPAVAGYNNSPLGPPSPGKPSRSADGSALEGFTAFVKDDGFAEVTP
jgi:CRISPR-associated protein Cmr1